MIFCCIAGLQRCGKSCRLRWINYLRPDLKRGVFSSSEENLIIDLHAVLGNRSTEKKKKRNLQPRCCSREFELLNFFFTALHIHHDPPSHE
jgi:hypothetical protein